MSQQPIWNYTQENAEIGVDYHSMIIKLLNVSRMSARELAILLRVKRQHLVNFRAGRVNKLKDIAKPELIRLSRKYIPIVIRRPTGMKSAITQDQVSEQIELAQMIAARRLNCVEPQQSAMF